MKINTGLLCLLFFVVVGLNAQCPPSYPCGSIFVNNKTTWDLFISFVDKYDQKHSQVVKPGSMELITDVKDIFSSKYHIDSFIIKTYNWTSRVAGPSEVDIFELLNNYFKDNTSKLNGTHAVRINIGIKKDSSNKDQFDISFEVRSEKGNQSLPLGVTYADILKKPERYFEGKSTPEEVFNIPSGIKPTENELFKRHLNLIDQIERTFPNKEENTDEKRAYNVLKAKVDKDYAALKKKYNYRD